MATKQAVRTMPNVLFHKRTFTQPATKPAASKARSRRAIAPAIKRHECRDDFLELESALLREANPRSRLQRELLSHVAGMLWRLSRVSKIETGLFEIQSLMLDDDKQFIQFEETRALNIGGLKIPAVGVLEPENALSTADRPPKWHLACAFLRVTNLQNHPFEGLGRYEARLWRQLVKLLSALERLPTSKRGNG